MNRRSLILAAAFGTAVPSLVKAKSLIDQPGDPLTARGLFAASKWAEEAYRNHPACRLVFADGQSTGWMEYGVLSRPVAGTAHEDRLTAERTYAVAIEVSATDVHGKRFVTSVPIDGRASVHLEQKRVDALAEARQRHDEAMARAHGRLAAHANELPF